MSWPKGKPRSAENRALIAAAHLGKRHTPEACARISAAQRGRAKSPEAVANASAGRRAVLDAYLLSLEMALYVHRLRRRGYGVNAIAVRVGVSPEALRRRLGQIEAVAAERRAA